jgi:hypothetical protein
MRLDRDPQQGNGDETPEAASRIMRRTPCLGHVTWQTVGAGCAGSHFQQTMQDSHWAIVPRQGLLLSSIFDAHAHL